MSRLARTDARDALISATSPGSPGVAGRPVRTVHDLLPHVVHAGAPLVGDALPVLGSAVGEHESRQDAHHAHVGAEPCRLAAVGAVAAA